MDESPQPQPPRPKHNSRLRLTVLLITLALILAVYLPMRTSRANDQLTLSLMTRNAESVRDALDHGADPDLPIQPMSAASQPHPRTLMEYARQMLHRSLRPSKNNPRTALMYAASNGEAKIVEELLQHNANVNLRLDTGYSALLYAASKPSSEIVAALLAKGADVQAHTQEGVTALMFAAQAGQTENVRLLLAKGEDLHAVDLRSQTALSLATENRHEESIQLLLVAGADARDLNSAQPSPNTPIVRVIGPGSGTITLSRTINGTTTISQGGQATRLPAPSRSPSIIAPLAFAAKYGSPALLRFLWEHADPNIRRQRGWGVLSNAVQSGNREAVQFLLSQNLPVNPPPGIPPDGPSYVSFRKGYDPSKIYTPLHYAAALPTPEITALLIAHDANVDAEDSFGTTPLLAAAVGNHLATVRLLIAHGANVRASEHTSGQNALMRGIHDVEVARLLLDHGLDVNARDHNGRTALMQCYTLPIATLLIERGADVNARDVLGHTALMTAVQSFQAPYVALLLKHGANVNSADSQGNTPLSMANAMRAPALSALLTAAGAKK